ncbi:hypothetical protein F5X98DRAFT_387229 [Xylaria grammica]|nr:hypothetical protein F5X98DRAFT_387229 [Xylaria grammica]
MFISTLFWWQSMKVIKKQEELSRPQEHVFLVNCIGSSDAQSEAAYYPNAPTADPDSVSVVTTPGEGLEHWEDGTTTTTFTDAGSTSQTVFTVTLGSRPNIGDIAGYASNSWDTSFACYAQAPTYLYTREGRDCSSVYDCSHAGKPLVPITHCEALLGTFNRANDYINVSGIGIDNNRIDNELVGNRSNNKKRPHNQHIADNETRFEFYTDGRIERASTDYQALQYDSGSRSQHLRLTTATSHGAAGGVGNQYCHRRDVGHHTARCYNNITSTKILEVPTANKQISKRHAR